MKGDYPMRTTARVASLGTALVFSVAVAACNKNNEGKVVDTTAAGMQTATVSVDTTPIKVSDIQVGKAIGSDKKIGNQTTTFAARTGLPSMYCSVTWLFASGPNSGVFPACRASDRERRMACA